MWYCTLLALFAGRHMSQYILHCFAVGQRTFPRFTVGLAFSYLAFVGVEQEDELLLD